MLNTNKNGLKSVKSRLLSGKKLISILFIIFAFNSAYSADFITELKISIKRAQDGSNVKYNLHLPNGEIKKFTGRDFIKGVIVIRGDIPLYFELYKGKGYKKLNIMINLQNAVYYKLDMEKIAGEWEYDFHFYY